MSVARRTVLKKLASAGGTALVTPSLAGLVACGNNADPGSPVVPAVPPAPAPPPPPPPVPVPDEPVESAFTGVYGELVRSVDCPELEIPDGFRCVRLSSGGLASSVRDGLVVPNGFDGMAAFPLPNGNVRLIRNHELVEDDEGSIVDPRYDNRATGGTTSLEVRISVLDGELAVELVDEFVSLAGTGVEVASSRARASARTAACCSSTCRPGDARRAAPTRSGACGKPRTQAGRPSASDPRPTTR